MQLAFRTFSEVPRNRKLVVATAYGHSSLCSEWCDPGVFQWLPILVGLAAGIHAPHDGIRPYTDLRQLPRNGIPTLLLCIKAPDLVRIVEPPHRAIRAHRKLRQRPGNLHPGLLAGVKVKDLSAGIYPPQIAITAHRKLREDPRDLIPALTRGIVAINLAGANNWSMELTV